MPAYSKLSLKRAPKFNRAAFTLVEIILVIALIAAAAGIIGGAGIFDKDSLKSRPPESVLISAIKAARAHAAEFGREVSLRYDDTGFFELSYTESAEIIGRVFLNSVAEEIFRNSQDGAGFSAFPMRVGLKVEFLPRYPEVIGRSSVSFSQSPLTFLRFSADSTMTPVKINLISENEKPLTLVFDPFSGLPEKDGGSQ